MANYLPVLLVSVTSNPSISAVPDDLSLETLPRGQVDYLSHDWEEEDVWRSWRNMTRQKNEIANGVRLENASWRTWWKQRNKLKTVTPETLNWLKDSDVTWLYGPLHTAVDWTPPPKPKPAPTSVDKEVPTSALDRLDLSTSTSRRNIDTNANRPANETKHKSILKYRSISELLTSDLPASIIGSPRSGMSPSVSEDEGDTKTVHGKRRSRPPLAHAKSDTHVATLVSPGRQALAAMGLRKDSPPRIGPPGHVQDATESSSSPCLTAENLSGDSSDLAPVTTPSTSPARTDAVDDTNPAPYGRQRRKHKHIAFNTFVEQCIAIDKPQTTSRSGSSKKHGKSIPGLGYETSGNWNGKTRGMRWDGIEDDEDDEAFANDEDDYYHSSESSSDGEDIPEVSPYIYYPYSHPSGSWDSGECAIGSSDESDGVHDESVFEDDEDEDIIEMRPSRNTLHKPTNMRSQSKVSTSSSSSASTTNSGLSNSSTAETSPSPARDDTTKESSTTRPNRWSSHAQTHHRLSNSSQSSNTTIMARRRKSFSYPRSSRRKRSSNTPHNHPLTIAPIAPTILKTTGVGSAWDGFGSGYGYEHKPYSNGGWMDGFGDEGYSDDGGAQKWYDGPGANKTPRGGDSNSSSDVGTPVELVYVPPVGRYGGVNNLSPQETTRHDEDDGQTEAERVYHHQKAFFSMEDGSNGRPSVPVPIVVRTPPAPRDEKEEEDADDYFNGPDLGEDFTRQNSFRGGRGRKSTAKSRESSQSSAADAREEEERSSRSRSRSRSRTPSPNLAPSGSTHSPSPASPSSVLLSPTLRGRSSQQSQEPVTRGRSSTRTSSSSLSDRDRSAHSSPLGSLSPDGSAIGIAAGAYGAYANGRVDRERDREKDRRKGKERGRERTERRLNHSISPDNTSSVPAGPPSGAAQSEDQQTLPSATATQQPPPSSPTSSPSNPVTSAPAAIKLDRSPPKPKDADETIVGRAVGMVSSAGAYFGFWPTDDRT